MPGIQLPPILSSLITTDGEILAPSPLCHYAPWLFPLAHHNKTAHTFLYHSCSDSTFHGTAVDCMSRLCGPSGGLIPAGKVVGSCQGMWLLLHHSLHQVGVSQSISKYLHTNNFLFQLSTVSICNKNIYIFTKSFMNVISVNICRLSPGFPIRCFSLIQWLQHVLNMAHRLPPPIPQCGDNPTKQTFDFYRQ